MTQSVNTCSLPKPSHSRLTRYIAFTSDQESVISKMVNRLNKSFNVYAKIHDDGKFQFDDHDYQTTLWIDAFVRGFLYSIDKELLVSNDPTFPCVAQGKSPELLKTRPDSVLLVLFESATRAKVIYTNNPNDLRPVGTVQDNFIPVYNYAYWKII